MICPVCGDKLRAIERSGVEVDICPGCKGIWLDRGELDKLISLESGASENSSRQNDVIRQPEQLQQTRRVEQPYREHHDHDDDDDHDNHNRRYESHDSDKRYSSHDSDRNGYQKKRKGSWLGDILGGLGGDD